jgi:hypothetical protein
MSAVRIRSSASAGAKGAGCAHVPQGRSRQCAPG